MDTRIKILAKDLFINLGSFKTKFQIRVDYPFPIVNHKARLGSAAFKKI